MAAYTRFALVILAAALQVLSLSPLNLYWLAFAFAVPLLFFLETEKRWWALLGGFFVYRFLAMSGIVHFVFDPIMFTASVVIFLGFPLSFRLIERLNGNAALLSAPVLWTFWDYLSARYTALPNFVMMAGNALGNSPFLGLASFWGITSLTFFALAVNLLVLWAITQWRKDRGSLFAPATAAVILLLAALLVSSVLLRKNRENYESLRESSRVVLVSQKDGLDETFRKNRPAQADLERLINVHLDEVRKNLPEESFDLLVLPDSMFDVDYDTTTDAEAFSKFSISNNASLIAGYRRLAKGLHTSVASNAITIVGGKKYNTLLFFDREGHLTDLFHKKYLAITGEYWPFGEWRPFYFDWLLTTDPGEFDDYAIFEPKNNLSSGETKIVRAGGLALAPSICVEIHYPAEMRKRVDLGAAAILNTSSNFWAPVAGLEQYLALTDNLRRIESVWLKTPILVNGRKEPPSLVLPDGEIRGPNSRMEIGDYQILPVELKF